MPVIEIVVIVCSILFVLGVAVWAFIRKKQGKSNCSCGECDGNCAKCKEAILKAREKAKKNNNTDNN